MPCLYAPHPAVHVSIWNSCNTYLCHRARQQSNSMSDAGRTLYAVSRAAKAKPNDADRLKKFLARFALDWDKVCLINK